MTHSFRILDPLQANAELTGKCALAVMAKAPRPGKVKTRLSPPLTPEQASALNACFLRDTVASLHRATLAAPAEWVISYTPLGEEGAFRGILPEGAMLLPQRGEDFGERLLFTTQDLFACGFSAVCLIDSDSPTVPTSEFITAATGLVNQKDNAVLGPSEDGGYYLIGMSKPHAGLFENIRWSTEHVAGETMQRAAELGLTVDLLQKWYDVDDAQSLARLHSEFFDPLSNVAQGYAAPHTREYLTALSVSMQPTSVVVESAV